MLPDLHFTPPHSGIRPLEEKLTIFPLDGISIGDCPLFLETENVSILDPGGKFPMQFFSLKRLDRKFLIMEGEI